MSIPRVPYDPALVAGQEAFLRKMEPEPVRPETILSTRERFAGLVRPPEETLAGRNVQWRDIEVPGPEGAPNIRLLWVAPEGELGAAPAIYHIHGGGMVLGDYRSSAREMADFAERYGLVGVSVEYRLAPEHPHPAPTEDCYAGLMWTAQHARELGIDATRMLVMGASAGGGLSAAVALMARDRGGPQLAGQVLICPMLDDRNIALSTHQYVNIGMWDRDTNITCFDALLGDKRGGPDVDYYAAPARCEDLSNLAPAFVELGSAELLRDESVDYASRIWATGGQAELHIWAGGHHGFPDTTPDALVSQAAIATRLNWIERALGL